MRGIVFLALLLVTSSPAVAAGEEVGVVVIGEATMQPQVSAQLERWLESKGHRLVTAPLPPEAVNNMIDCFVIEDEDCARTVINKHAKASSVVFARVELDAASGDGTRSVALTAYWFDKGKGSVAERRTCKACTDVTLRTTADELMTALAGTAGAAPASDTALIDPNDAETPRGGSGSRALPLALIGVGAAAAITGGIFYAIDEDVADAGTTQKTYRDSATAGVGLAIGGAVVAGIGGYLLLRSSGDSAPIAALTGDSAYIGWTGRF